jgi:UDP-glucose 4-epimerase
MSGGILILGGNGFLGKALSQRLIGQNRRIHRLLRTPTTSLGSLDNIHRGSIDDTSVVAGLLQECDTVFHLASATTPGSSAFSPAMEAELNLTPSLKFLQIMQDHSDKHLIFISSGGTLYGNPEAALVTESAPLAPLSYHGAGKIALETFIRTFSQLSHNHVTVLRPSNFYGPGQPLRSGFGLIRTMLEHVRCNKPMEIWGDGETVRDYLYIDDMVNACCMAHEKKSGGYRILNTGSGTGYSINQVHALVEQITGKALKINHQPRRPVDVNRIVLDYSAINTEWGWAPQITLAEGIKRTWQWLQSQPL